IEDETPPFKYKRYYQLPADYIGFREIYNCEAEFEVFADKKLATDAASPLQLIYTAKITDTGDFDPLFTQILVLHLAIMLSVIIPEQPTLIDRLEQLMKQFEMFAKQADAQESTPPQLKLKNAYQKKNYPYGKY